MRWKNGLVRCIAAMALMGSYGCSFDTFVEESYELIRERHPEYSWLEDSRYEQPLALGDSSLEHLQETLALERGVLSHLQRYPYGELTPEQQIVYDEYRFYLEQEVAAEPFLFHQLWHEREFRLTNPPLIFFEQFPLYDENDADLFMDAVEQLDWRFGQVLDNYQQAVAESVLPARRVVEQIAMMWQWECEQNPQTGRVDHYWDYFTFLLWMNEVELGEETMATLEQRYQAAADRFTPVCEQLISFFDEAVAAAPVDYSDTPAAAAHARYYDYALARYTDTTLSADEIHQLGRSELAMLREELGNWFDALGYPPEESIAERMQRLEDDCPKIPTAELEATYRQWIQQATDGLTALVDIPIETALELYYVPYPMVGYIRASLDGSGPGLFIYGYSPEQQEVSGVMQRTAVFHETVPGHHVQLSIGQEHPSPPFQQIHFSVATVEGWAFYAEQLALEQGWFDNDVCAEMGQLWGELLRAVRLVIDSGLNAKQWSIDQAVTYFTAQLGNTEAMDAQFVENELLLALGTPGYPSAYYLGMLKIRELREWALQRAGEDFDLVEFHRQLLGHGQIHQQTMERVVKAYYTEKYSRE